MRHALFHVTGIVILVLYVLFRLSGVLQTLMQDASPYTLSKEELEVTRNETQLIPKIIHQVYLGWDNLPMPSNWKAPQQSCIDLHPDWEYMLWTNESARNLLTTTYPWFLETWDDYEYPIQRADSIRYFILAHHGGIYIDLDNGCNRTLDPLLTVPAWMPGTKNHLGLTNHIMGATRNHTYFQLLVNSLEQYDYNWLLPYMTIMNSAGPHFVSMVWHEHLQCHPTPEEEVRVLGQEEYVGCEWSFFTKEEGGSWYNWDTQLFVWVAKHIIIVVGICFICLCGAISALWWMGWKVILMIRTVMLKMRTVKMENHSPALPVWQKAD